MTDHVFLGGFAEATDLAELARLRISGTVNCAPESCGDLRGRYGAGHAYLELDCEDTEELPTPATHAILMVLKAGESVFQTLLLTKNSGSDRSCI